MKATAKSFPPVIDVSARILILGTMPGVMSLRENQYYANPRNMFWRILTRVLRFSENATYSQKIATLRTNQIALWDVMHSCERSGSLDANIDQQTIEPNDFVFLYRENPNIKKICFNGAKAETEYIKRILPNLSGKAKNIKLLRLPSTSPAMARMSFDQKIKLWSEAIIGKQQ